MDNKMTAEQALMKELRNWRSERPDEWKMDEIIRLAEQALSAPRVPDIILKWVASHPPELPDHACAECTPQSDCIKPGFQCGYHVAISMLAASPEPVADDTQQVIADLRAEVKALKGILANIASIAHAGGIVEKSVYGNGKLDSWNAIRRLTLKYFNKSGSLDELRDRVTKAIDAARLREGGARVKINMKIDCVTGAFDTDTGKLVCVQSAKYSEVELCFSERMNIPFAKIKLHDRDRYVDAQAVFKDAVRLGKEIERRWNEFPALEEENRRLREGGGE